jgi:hypothetical protein
MHVVVLETLIRRAPLGIRFVDLARGGTVSDDLAVAAWPLAAPALQQSAVCSPLSGIYGFRTLPGLRGYEVGEQPADDWCASPPAAPPGIDPGDLAALRDLVDAAGSTTANFAVAIEDHRRAERRAGSAWCAARCGRAGAGQRPGRS